MFLSAVTNHGAMPALAKAMKFAEARMGVIADNVANIHTPGYRAKTLDPRGFQRALRDALEAKNGDPRRPLLIDNGRELRTDRQGRLQVRPGALPAQNVLFHDGTNLSLERQMADLAETTMSHELAATLWKSGMDRLRTAIRGRMA